MKKFILLFILSFTFLHQAYAIGGASCENSTPVIIGENACDHTVSREQWFSFTATTAININISTCGIYAGYIVYKRDVCNIEQVIANNSCNDAGAEATIFVDNGATIYFAIVTDLQVSYNWTFSTILPYDGEFCENTITAQLGSNNVDATNNPNNKKHYSYTATSDTWITINACNLVGAPSEVSLQSNCNNAAVLLSNNCDDEGILSSFEVTSGEEYILSFTGTNANYTFDLSEASPTEGDLCELPITTTASTYQETFTQGQDMWYRYQASFLQTVNLSTCDLVGSGAVEFMIYKETCTGEIVTPTNTCANEQELAFLLEADETILINIIGSQTEANEFSWTLSTELYAYPLGESCVSPKQALIGTNETDNSIRTDWFVYTPTKNGTVTVSSCAQTTEDTYVEIYSDCNETYVDEGDQECDDQAEVSFDVVANQNYYIVWYDDYTSALFDWNLSFEEQIIKQGDVCADPFVASNGTNHASHNTGDQWFEYTTTMSGTMEITSCGLTTLDTELDVYKGNCSGNMETSQDDCEAQSKLILETVSGTKYLIRWSGEWTNDEYDWEINEYPITGVSSIEEAVFSPNPVQDHFTVFASGLLQILNPDGKILIEQSVEMNETIDVTSLSKGAYFIKVINANNVIRVNLVVE